MLTWPTIAKLKWSILKAAKHRGCTIGTASRRLRLARKVIRDEKKAQFDKHSCVTGKVCFQSEAEAAAAVLDLTERGVYHRQYDCKICSTVHNTTHRKKDYTMGEWTDWKDCDSSTIKRYRYSESRLELQIEFVHGGTYSYTSSSHADLDSLVFDAFDSSPSKGKHLAEHIKPIFPYAKLEKSAL